LTHSLPSLRHDQGARDAARPVVDRLSVNASPEWTMARIAALLSPYYEKDVPQAVRIMEAEDWAEALAEYPQWAIQNAVRWWKSEHNHDRRKRPMEGDIAERCRIEVQPVRAAKYYLDREIVPVASSAPALPRPSLPDQEERQAISARIMAEVFQGKKIGGE
jgi:hypothetical protein